MLILSFHSIYFYSVLAVSTSVFIMFFLLLALDLVCSVSLRYVIDLRFFSLHYPSMLPRLVLTPEAQMIFVSASYIAWSKGMGRCEVSLKEPLTASPGEPTIDLCRGAQLFFPPLKDDFTIC